eukprot:364215-Chlamydomonas_euryale.AAC.20
MADSSTDSWPLAPHSTSPPMAPISKGRSFVPASDAEAAVVPTAPPTARGGAAPMPAAEPATAASAGAASAPSAPPVPPVASLLPVASATASSSWRNSWPFEWPAITPNSATRSFTTVLSRSARPVRMLAGSTGWPLCARPPSPFCHDMQRHAAAIELDLLPWPRVRPHGGELHCTHA